MPGQGVEGVGGVERGEGVEGGGVEREEGVEVWAQVAMVGGEGA